jgi:heat shock protein HslJ
MPGARFTMLCSILAISTTMLAGSPRSAMASDSLAEGVAVDASDPTRSTEMALLMSPNTWEAQRLHDLPLVEGTRITARFDGTRVTGSAGCNQYSGSYISVGTPEGGIFRITSPIITTRMACLGPGVMEQETSYLDALKKARSYMMSSNELRLRDADDKVILQFFTAP